MAVTFSRAITSNYAQIQFRTKINLQSNKFFKTQRVFETKDRTSNVEGYEFTMTDEDSSTILHSAKLHLSSVAELEHLFWRGSITYYHLKIYVLVNIVDFFC